MMKRIQRRGYIDDRVLQVCDYILETNCTVREAAKQFNVSKSTVHKDVTERIWYISSPIGNQIREILNNHKAERAIKGGLATKEMYEKLKKDKKL